MQGPPLRKRIEGSSVRPARVSDVEDCKRVCMQVHGHDRAGELADAMKDGTAVVVERHERITGYATALAFFGHAVAETNLDLQAMIPPRRPLQDRASSCRRAIQTFFVGASRMAFGSS